MIHKDLFRSLRVLGSVGNKIHHQTTQITKLLKAGTIRTEKTKYRDCEDQIPGLTAGPNEKNSRDFQSHGWATALEFSIAQANFHSPWATGRVLVFIPVKHIFFMFGLKNEKLILLIHVVVLYIYKQTDRRTDRQTDMYRSSSII